MEPGPSAIRSRSRSRRRSSAAPATFTRPTDASQLPGGPADISFEFVRRLLLNDDYSFNSAAARCVKAMMLASPSGSLRVGSICTGSGAAEVAVGHFPGLLLRLLGVEECPWGDGSVRCTTNEFGCELDKRKADWLKTNLGLSPIFANAALMGCKAAEDLVSGDMMDIPSCDLLSAGFSCKDLSSLSANKQDRFDSIVAEIRSCLTASLPEIHEKIKDKQAGTTALTLGGVLRYIDKHRPPMLILENVLDFEKIVEMVQDLLGGLGYLTSWVTTTPWKTVGIPQSRPRIYMVGCHFSQLGCGPPGCLGSEMEAVMASSSRHLQLRPTPMSQFLIDIDSDLMSFWMDKLNLTDDDAEHNEDASWNRKHLEAFAKAKLTRPGEDTFACFEAGLPHRHQQAMFRALPLRMREIILYTKHMASKVTAKDCSQSLERGAEPWGRIGCLSGSSLHYLFEGENGAQYWRTLLGEEAMALQGLTSHNFPCLRQASNRLLCDLAGNAFNLPCFALVLYSALVVVGSCMGKQDPSEQ